MRNIKFIMVGDHAAKTSLPIEPAVHHTPEWWKRMEQHYPSGALDLENRIPNLSPKKCFPLFDAMTAGYLLRTWADMLVTQTSDGPVFKWKVTVPMVEQHQRITRDMPAPVGYHPQVFKYEARMRTVTDRGYSMFVVPAWGHNPLTLHAVPGIVDSDGPTTAFSYPFWVRADYEGVVPKGTPLAQIVPFRRESWVSHTAVESHEDYRAFDDANFNGTLVGHYRRFVRKRIKFK